MPILINRPSSSLLNSAQLASTPAAPPATQLGIAAAPSSLTSFRNQAQAEPSFSLCSCFSRFVNWIPNWIKGIFSKLLGAQSNEAVVSEVTHERLIQKGNECIDAQFDRPPPFGAPFRFKMVVAIQFNDRLLATPYADVATDSSAFKAEVKRVLSEALQSQDLGGDVKLGIETCFFKDAGGVSGVDSSMDLRNSSMDLRTGRSLSGSLYVSGHNVSQKLAIIQRLAQDDRERSNELARFLMPELDWQPATI